MNGIYVGSYIITGILITLTTVTVLANHVKNSISYSEVRVVKEV
jgi:hypothetical protein